MVKSIGSPKMSSFLTVECRTKMLRARPLDKKESNPSICLLFLSSLKPIYKIDIRMTENFFLQVLVMDLLGEIQYVSGGFLVGGVCILGLFGNLALFVLLSKQVRS